MSEQTNQAKSRAKLILFSLVFLLPVAGSWYLVFFTDYAREGNGAEHGDLIQPPRQLENIELTWVGRDSTKQEPLYGKWSMLFYVDGPCEASCEDSLYRLQQIRLATGRELQHVQRIAVIDEGESVEFSDNLSKKFPGQLYISKEALGESYLQQFHDQNITEQGSIFLIDPRGFLMMRYPADTEPTGIIRDLSRMLRISG